jgi:hypothetical protein
MCLKSPYEPATIVKPRIKSVGTGFKKIPEFVRSLQGSRFES